MLMKTKKIKAQQYGDFTYCCGCGNKDRENRDENHTCTQIYCVCEYCSYATRKKHHMVTHMHSEKHRKNIDKDYIILEDADSIVARLKEKEQKKHPEEPVFVNDFVFWEPQKIILQI